MEYTLLSNLVGFGSGHGSFILSSEEKNDANKTKNKEFISTRIVKSY